MCRDQVHALAVRSSGVSFLCWEHLFNETAPLWLCVMTLCGFRRQSVCDPIRSSLEKRTCIYVGLIWVKQSPRREDTARSRGLEYRGRNEQSNAMTEGLVTHSDQTVLVEGWEFWLRG